MKVTVSRELLRQVLNAACSPYCAQDLGQLMPAIKAALEQPAPVQEPAAEILSDVIHRNAKKLVFTHHGLSLPVGTKLYNATQPAPVQEQQPAPASKPVLLQCLGCERVGTQEQLSASTDCDCWLHTQPAPVQEPSHDVVAGAIFDFAGFLTSHKVMIEVGSCSNASPMVERIKEWSGNRGLSLENPDVFGWQMRTAQPRKAVKLSDSEVREIYENHAYVDCTGMLRAIEAAVWEKLGVTE